jgi:hypothetical protein
MIANYGFVGMEMIKIITYFRVPSKNSINVRVKTNERLRKMHWIHS